MKVDRLIKESIIWLFGVFVLFVILSFVKLSGLSSFLVQLESEDTPSVASLAFLLVGIVFTGSLCFFAALRRGQDNDLDINLQETKQEAVEHEITEEELNRREKEQEEENKATVAILLKDLELKSSIESFAEQLLQNLARQYNGAQGLFFVLDKESQKFRLNGSYAYYSEEPPHEFTFAEGISGQVAVDKKALSINNLPEDYITVLSGLGKGAPKNMFIIPIFVKDETYAIVEMASFSEIDDQANKVLEMLMVKLNNFMEKILKQ